MDIEIRREPVDNDSGHFPAATRHPVLKAFVRELKISLREPFAIHLPHGGSEVTLSIQLKDCVLTMQFSTKRLSNVTAEVFVWWVLGSALLLLLIATVFLRNQIRPIRKLAEVAERFGKGQDSIDFRPQGASEVRQAGRSFIAMRERLKRMITTRTEMLAGISHDLRTPLTRMRLSLAMLSDAATAKALLADVQDMEKMIQEYLRFRAWRRRQKAPAHGA